MTDEHWTIPAPLTSAAVRRPGGRGKPQLHSDRRGQRHSVDIAYRRCLEESAASLFFRINLFHTPYPLGEVRRDSKLQLPSIGLSPWDEPDHLLGIAPATVIRLIKSWYGAALS
jgi:hypothetical protein